MPESPYSPGLGSPNAMDVFEKGAAGAIQELEIMVSERRSAFFELRDVPTEPPTTKTGSIRPCAYCNLC
ncbi:MAG: hypothetical protein JW932_15890 [Deltaproteobacteria bacterium]|nr:hypothetical protein [Deltaproteobacteria bacterium]